MPAAWSSCAHDSPRSSPRPTSSAATARARPPSTPCRRHRRFPPGRFTAIMGPSGSGKSTLMHSSPASTGRRAGTVVLDGVELAELDDDGLTKLRRDKVGFIFQSFNLLPVLTARGEHPAAALDRRPQARPRVARPAHRHRRPARPPHPPARRALRRPAAARRGRPRADLPARRSSSPTSRPATSTPRPPRGARACCAASVDEFGQTVIMVTHDPEAAAVADRARSCSATAASSTTARRRPTASRAHEAVLALRSPCRASAPASCASPSPRSPSRSASR